MDIEEHTTIAPMIQSKVWTVAEAKARLSEVLRCATDEGPQRIGTRKSYVVVPEALWREITDADDNRQPMGQWLLEHMPREEGLVIPSRTETGRAIPFANEYADPQGDA